MSLYIRSSNVEFPLTIQTLYIYEQCFYKNLFTVKLSRKYSWFFNVINMTL